MFVDWKNQYNKKLYATQSNLQIQHNTKIPMTFFTKLEKHQQNLYETTKDLTYSQSNGTKRAKQETLQSLTLKYIAKPQILKQQDEFNLL